MGTYRPGVEEDELGDPDVNSDAQALVMEHVVHLQGMTRDGIDTGRVCVCVCVCVCFHLTAALQ